MAEQVSERTCGCAAGQSDAICIHTNAITDVCLDKDCIEDLRVYLTEEAQTRLNASTGAKARSVELMQVSMDVEQLGFQRGNYSVDITFYYHVRGDTAGNAAGALEGVAVFNKRVVLYGGESSTKIYSSRTPMLPRDAGQMPEAIAEVIDPMVLSSRVVECGEQLSHEVREIPKPIRVALGGPLAQGDDGRRLYVTIGQFSTIRLEREAQLTVPGGRDCIPSKFCCADAGSQEDPCDVFSRIDFPYRAFYPNHTDADAAPVGQDD